METFQAYQIQAEPRNPRHYYPLEKGLNVAVLGLCEEVGEVACHVKWHLSGQCELDKDAAAEELGDVLWFVTRTADLLGFTLADIARINIEKTKLRFDEPLSEEKEHTSALPNQGPWEAGLDIPFVANNNPDPRIVWSMSQMIADCRIHGLGRARSEANARLAAAAPDLLHACEMVWRFGGDGTTDDGISTKYLLESAMDKATYPPNNAKEQA